MAQCAAPKTSDIIRESSRLRDREVPPRKRRRGARLRGNGDRGTCLTEGEALLRRSAGYIFIPFQEIPRQARNDKQSARSLMGEAHILGKIKIIGILFSKRRFSVDKVRFLCYFVSVIGHKRIFANIGLNMKAQTFLPHTGKVATIGGIA